MTDTAQLPGQLPRPGTLRAGWRVLRAVPDRVLVPAIVLSATGFVAHLLLQYLIGVSIAGTHTCARNYLGAILAADCGPTNQRAQLALVAGIFVIYTVGHLVVAGLYRVALDISTGRPTSGPFTGWFSTRVLMLALLAGALMTVSTAVFGFPVLVVGFFIRYALLFALDQGLGPAAALKASLKLVGSKPASELGFVLLSVLALVLGFVALGAGLFVAVPVVLVAQTQRYLEATRGGAL